MVLAKKEMQETVNAFKEFLNSLNLTEEQREKAISFLKSLFILISVSSQPGLKIYNKQVKEELELKTIMEQFK